MRLKNLSGVGTVSEAGRWSTSSVEIRGSCRCSLIFAVYSASIFCFEARLRRLRRRCARRRQRAEATKGSTANREAQERGFATEAGHRPSGNVQENAAQNGGTTGYSTTPARPAALAARLLLAAAHVGALPHPPELVRAAQAHLQRDAGRRRLQPRGAAGVLLLLRAVSRAARADLDRQLLPDREPHRRDPARCSGASRRRTSPTIVTEQIDKIGESNAGGILTFAFLFTLWSSSSARGVDVQHAQRRLRHHRGPAVVEGAADRDRSDRRARAVHPGRR